jgi:hypothetical protein
MTKLSNEQEQCINRNEQILKKNDFSQFYQEIEKSTIRSGPITDFFMLECGVNLWDCLEEIPRFMFEFSVQKEVIIPGKYETIPKGMFFESDIEDITIAEGITTIQPSAFYCCKNLKKIWLPKTVVEIGERAFYKTDVILITPKRNQGDVLKFPEDEKDWYDAHVQYV